MLLLLTPPKVKMIYQENKGHKLIKKKQSLTIKFIWLFLALESWLEISCIFLLNHLEDKKISENFMGALTRNRTLKIGWGFKVAENTFNSMARMEKWWWKGRKNTPKNFRLGVYYYSTKEESTIMLHIKKRRGEVSNSLPSHDLLLQKSFAMWKAENTAGVMTAFPCWD